jgi:hypothetical protein
MGSECLPENPMVLAFRGFHPENISIQLSTMVFMGQVSNRIGNGWQIPQSGITGRCPPPSLLRKQLDACVGLADPAVVQMVDLRQGTRLNPCCTHVDNFGRDKYVEDILDAMETRKKLFANWAAKNNLDSCVLCATTLVSPWTPH